MVDATPALVASAVSVLRSSRQVVRDVSFELRYGEALAVLGPNGAGKSSLLRAVSGLAAHGGSVLVAGRPLTQLSARERAGLLAYVPQQPSLAAPVAVRDVVAQGRYVHTWGIRALSATDNAAIERALELCDIASLARRSFTELSRGEQQRVTLARALCTGAAILCLDEPTAALDVAHALQVYELVRRLRDQGCAVLIVLHQLADALRYADRALLLSASGPARLGLAREVIQPEHVRSVYGVRMRWDAGLEFELLPRAEACP